MENNIGIIGYDLMLNATFWGIIWIVFILSYFAGFFFGRVLFRGI